MLAVDHAELDEGGLEGDHGRAGKRAVTLFQAEHIDVITQFLQRSIGSAGDIRQSPWRNLHVSGFNLSACRGARLQCGNAVLEITTPCAPCSRMHEAFGPGGYNALRGHGGWCARVISGGAVRLDDSVFRL
ncbi:MAG: MOSC domain-containing protein [Pseudomonadota bacterium]